MAVQALLAAAWLVALLATASAQTGGPILSDDDGGLGALPPPRPPPDAPAGLDDASVREVSLLKIAAKHFTVRHTTVPASDSSPRERMLLHRWSHYWRAYEELLRPIRHKPGAVFVEVGGGGGGSAQVWSEWLGPEVEVHVIDIDDISPMMRGVRVTPWQADQANVSFWRDTFFPAVGKIDALIDDGGHEAAQQLVTLREALPWVKPGGVLSVEDTHTSYMPGQWCGRFQEVDLVKAQLREAAAGRDTPLEEADLAADMPAFVLPSSLGRSVSSLVDGLIGPGALGADCTVRSSRRVFTPWSFMQEARTLTLDLDAWWLDPSLHQHAYCNGDGRPEPPGDHHARPDSRITDQLDMARTARGSLLGRAWRRWFTQNVASVRFYESIVVVQRWWHEDGRKGSATPFAGSFDARFNALGDNILKGGHISSMPPGQRAATLRTGLGEVMGPHFAALVARLEDGGASRGT